MTTQTIAGRYELQELVGAGGMSSVYKARDTLLERNVALKILHQHYGADAEYAERFRREARAVAQLSHPNIVTVIDRGEADGRHFIVFEYIEGESLKHVVERTGPLPVRRALEIALEIAGALSFAHRNGIVHRDVKPQNVLLNGDGRAKVTDFGIARSLDVERGMTQTGTILGTSNYIAPEQASGEHVSPQTDVYSLGVVLFELLTGRLPFEGESFVQIAMKHVNEPPPDVTALRREVPQRVGAAVRRALAKDPADRFASMDELAAELRACLAGADARPADEQATTIVPRVAPPPRPPRPRRRRSRSRWPLLAAGSAALVTAGAVAALLALGGGGGSPTTAAPPGKPLHLRGVGAYDPPPGDGSEHDEEAPNATDGDAVTYWTTQSYHYGNGSLGKPGVGLVLDGGRSGTLAQVGVASETPGFRARILAGDSPDGRFHIVSQTKLVTGDTIFAIKDERPARYWVVWITNLGDNEAVRINEVRAA